MPASPRLTSSRRAKTGLCWPPQNSPSRSNLTLYVGFCQILRRYTMGTRSRSLSPQEDEEDSPATPAPALQKEADPMLTPPWSVPASPQPEVVPIVDKTPASPPAPRVGLFCQACGSSAVGIAGGMRR